MHIVTGVLEAIFDWSGRSMHIIKLYTILYLISNIKTHGDESQGQGGSTSRQMHLSILRNKPC